MIDAVVTTNQLVSHLSAFGELEVGVVPEHDLDLLGQWTPALQEGTS
jgi:hypothetical protein